MAADAAKARLAFPSPPCRIGPESEGAAKHIHGLFLGVRRSEGRRRTPIGTGLSENRQAGLSAVTDLVTQSRFRWATASIANA